jgi:hypothetical protein
MRVRTAKQRAQRIDLDYFKHAQGLKRWRLLLSRAVPLAALLWVTAYAAAGSRAPYSAGPVSSAHAFAEMRCQVCHTGTTAIAGFRAHTTDKACLTCHDAPAHAVSSTPAPACAACHRDHRGRVQLAKTDDGFCVECHGALKMTQGPPKVAAVVGPFPSGHPEFAAIQSGAPDPARMRFNHAVHLKNTIRGANGPEQLACASCHKPEAARVGAKTRGPATTGLMAPVTYEQNCARCHPLFFDERIEQAAPHAKPEAVRGFVQQALLGYIRDHPGDISKPDSAFRRLPLNFRRPPEPPARDAQEWVERRAGADERLLWNKTCAECHESASPFPTSAGYPSHLPTNITKRWMPRAAFDHTPHLMVTCASCHVGVKASTKTSDVLLPNQGVCATCHVPAKSTLRQGSGRSESRCFECHRYHDWTKSHPVTPSFSLMDFK